jgi:protein arginine N-methyltransferase 1
MWLAPIQSGLGDKKMEDFDSAMNDWNLFVEDTQSYYGVNMNALTKAYRAEHEKFYLKVSLTIRASYLAVLLDACFQCENAVQPYK